MKLTKSKLKQIIQEEIKIINENIGARDRSIEEDLEEIIGAFKDILDGVFPNEIIKADDFQSLRANFESLKTRLGDIHAGAYDESLKKMLDDIY